MIRSATLLFNPAAGVGRPRDTADRLARILTSSGLQTSVMFSTAEAGSIIGLAQEASQASDLVIACGGDGTVHQALQGVAQSAAALGVVPLGTANALARNLGLPLDPGLALEKLLTYKPTVIPLGFVETASGSRWFVVMAGAGPDGALAHQVTAAEKARFGRKAYYTRAARLYMTHRFPAFQTEYRLYGSADWKKCTSVALMASRLPNLGGLFSGLTRSSRLGHPHLLVQLIAAPAKIAFPAWMTFSRLWISNANPWLASVEVEEVRCTPLASSDRVFVQADGEPIGLLPCSLRVVPSALRLMMPVRSSLLQTSEM